MTSTPGIGFDTTNFKLDRLDSIMPIAHHQQAGEIDVTLLAIESYADGFLASVRLSQDWQPPNPLPPEDQMEHPLMLRGAPLLSNVTDDLGNSYRCHMRMGAGGAGGHTGISCQFNYCFVPALAAGATKLAFELTIVERPRYGDDGEPTWNADDVHGGPWRLHFQLETATDSSIEVIPVGVQIDSDGIRATVTTIERHTWGFIVNSRIDWQTSTGSISQPCWHATDDLGKDYGRGNCGGGGDSVDGDVNCWRMFSRFQPAVDPRASEIRLRLESFSAQRAVLADDGQFDRWETERRVTDIGEVVVPLR